MDPPGSTNLCSAVCSLPFRKECGSGLFVGVMNGIQAHSQMEPSVLLLKVQHLLYPGMSHCYHLSSKPAYMQVESGQFIKVTLLGNTRTYLHVARSRGNAEDPAYRR